MTARGGKAALAVASAVAFALALAACGDTPVQFQIALEFDPDERHGCDPAGCAAYRLECGAMLGIRIEHLASGDVVSQCRFVQRGSAGDTCALTAVSVPLSRVSVGMSRLQVAVWNPSVLVDRGGQCPDEDITDVHPRGVPRADYRPRPAFGGAIYFDVGAERVATVPLACTDPVQLDVGECPSTRVVATVRELATGREPADPEALELGFVQPVFELDEGPISPDAFVSQGEWMFPDPEPMGFEADIDSWSVTLPELAVGNACVEARETVGVSATTVTCYRVVGGAGELALEGWLLGADALAAALAASGLSNSEFRDRGLVVGRAVGPDGAGLAGVAVTTSAGTVGYVPDVPPPGGQPSQLTATESNGLFFSMDAPFEEGEWSAAPPEPGLVAAIPHRAGLIPGKVSALVIQFSAP